MEWSHSQCSVFKFDTRFIKVSNLRNNLKAAFRMSPEQGEPKGKVKF